MSSWMLVIAVGIVAVGIYFAVSAWLDAYEEELNRKYEAWLERERWLARVKDQR